MVINVNIRVTFFLQNPVRFKIYRFSKVTPTHPFLQEAISSKMYLRASASHGRATSHTLKRVQINLSRVKRGRKYIFKFTIRGPLELYSVHLSASSDLLLQSSDLPVWETRASGLNALLECHWKIILSLPFSWVKSFSEFDLTHIFSTRIIVGEQKINVM